MGVGIGVSLVLTLYTLIMGFTFWYCVLADPAKSPTARFVSHTLPMELMKYVGKILGSRGVKIVEDFVERLLALIYLTVVLGGFSLLWCYAYPWARESDHVADYHLTLGYGIVFMALGTWRLTMTSSPGIITAETIHFHDHFPYDDLLYVEGRHDRAKGIPRLPRSKFDRFKHHRHVARFDHYCGWVAGTIGEENYRLFLLFVLTQFAMCVYGSVVLTKLFWGEIKDKNLFGVSFFDKTTGREYSAGTWIVVQYLFHRHIYEAGVLAIMAVMSVALAFFLGYHCYITSAGMTTNEHYKWGEVKKWHKGQVRKYEKHKKKETAKVGGDKSTTDGKIGAAQSSKATEGDGTLRGGIDAEAKAEQTIATAPSTSLSTMEDPGPFPENIYNRGFLENWKEVLHPISLRRKAAAAQEVDKTKAA